MVCHYRGGGCWLCTHLALAGVRSARPRPTDRTAVPTDTRAELWTEGPAASDSLSSSAAVPAVTLVPTNEYRPKAHARGGTAKANKQPTNEQTNEQNIRTTALPTNSCAGLTRRTGRLPRQAGAVLGSPVSLGSPGVDVAAGATLWKKTPSSNRSQSAWAAAPA